MPPRRSETAFNGATEMTRLPTIRSEAEITAPGNGEAGRFVDIPVTPRLPQKMTPLACPPVLKIQLRIWYALILHDIKSRFFGNGLGYIVMILWPFGHLVIILAINSGRLPPHGSSMILYASTGVVPFIAFNYVARFIMMGSIMNKSFLHYTLIQPLDLMIARTLLEIVTCYIVITILLISMAVIGIDIVPENPAEAATAWLASIFLGIGFGFINGVIVMALPLWQIISIVFFISAWLTSGIILDPELLPAPYGYYMSFNPLVHAVEWMREAYYPDFRANLLDRSYLLGFSFVCFFIGVMVTRFGRATLVHPR